MVDHIRPLTSIRFAFALWVVVLHASALLEKAGFDRQSVAFNLVITGYLGVQFFFVLSGFILTYTYCSGQNQASRKTFWVARFARIYPVYLVSLALVFPFMLYQSWLLVDGRSAALAELARTGALQLTLTQAWFPSAGLTWNAPGWSLSVEAFFYLLFPFLLARLPDLRSGVLIALLAAAFLLSQGIAGLAELLRLPGLAGIPATRHEDAHGFWGILISCNPLVRLPEFFSGAVTALLFLRHREAIRPYGGWLIAAPAVVVIAILLFLSPRIPIVVLNIGGLMLFAAMFFVGLASHTGRFTAFLSQPLPVRLGEASYSIYILHFPIGMWMLWVIRRFVPIANDYPLACFFVYIATVILVSVFIFEKFERPMRRAIRNRFSQPGNEQPGFSRSSWKPR